MTDAAPAVEYRVAKSSNVLFSVVVVVVVAVMGWLNAHEARLAAGRVTQATECIIEEFADHRAATRSAHQAMADKLGTTYTTKAEDRPVEALDRLQEACAPFTKR